MDNKPKPRSLYISDEDWKWLQEEAVRQNRNRPALIREIIKKEREAKKKK